MSKYSFDLKKISIVKVSSFGILFDLDLALIYFLQVDSSLDHLRHLAYLIPSLSLKNHFNEIIFKLKIMLVKPMRSNDQN